MCNIIVVNPMTVLDLTKYKCVSNRMFPLPLIEGVSRYTTTTKREKTDNHFFIP